MSMAAVCSARVCRRRCAPRNHVVLPPVLPAVCNRPTCAHTLQPQHGTFAACRYRAFLSASPTWPPPPPHSTYPTTTTCRSILVIPACHHPIRPHRLPHSHPTTHRHHPTTHPAEATTPPATFLPTCLTLRQHSRAPSKRVAAVTTHTLRTNTWYTLFCYTLAWRAGGSLSVTAAVLVIVIACSPIPGSRTARICRLYTPLPVLPHAFRLLRITGCGNVCIVACLGFCERRCAAHCVLLRAF